MSKTTQKDTFDKFYTNKDVTSKCINILKGFVNDEYYFIEPSAGCGNFLDALNVFTKVKGYDILPEREDIEQKDWFSVDLSTNTQDIAIVGNPPFGLRNKLSKQFIEHALSFENVKVVAMVLPNAWNKHTLQKTFPRNWKLAYCDRLNKNSFTFEGKSYNVPCTFQVWIKDYQGEDFRWEENPATTHKDFTFVKSAEDADIFIFGAGMKIIQPCEVKPNNRGYYLKSNVSINVLKDRLKSIDWDSKGNATAGGGVYWITKPELVKEYQLYKENI